MPEVLTIHMGGCGNELAPYVWRRLCEEHKVEPDGVMSDPDSPVRLQNIGAFFQETEALSYRPRALVVDSDPHSVQLFRLSRYGRLLPDDNAVVGSKSAKDNWGAGFYGDGRILMACVLEAARKEMEACDCPQGFTLIHSISGGTGGGMGSLLLRKLKDEYPDKIVNTMSVLSSYRYQHSIMEAYNALLTTEHLVNHSDFSFLFNNAKLGDICLAGMDWDTPVFLNINRAIAGAISGITSFLRFPGQLNGDLRKMAMNTVLYQKLHFLTAALGPITHTDEDDGEHRSMRRISEAAFQPMAQLSRCLDHPGGYLHLSCQFRGPKIPKDFDHNMQFLKHEMWPYFLGCKFCNLKTSHCPIAPGNLCGSACFVGNHTGIRYTFIHLVETFRKHVRRASLLEMYRKAGVELAHFKTADIASKLVVREYSRADYVGRRH